MPKYGVPDYQVKHILQKVNDVPTDPEHYIVAKISVLFKKLEIFLRSFETETCGCVSSTISTGKHLNQGSTVQFIVTFKPKNSSKNQILLRLE